MKERKLLESKNSSSCFIVRMILLIVLICLLVPSFTWAWNTPASDEKWGYITENGKKSSKEKITYFAKLDRESGNIYHRVGHAYIIERAIQILHNDGYTNWASIAQSNLLHLVSGSRHADAYKGRIVIRLKLEVLWGLVTADYWDIDLTCVGGCDHYYNKNGKGLNLTEWSILARNISHIANIVKLGIPNLTLGFLDLDVEVIPDIKFQYPSAVQLCQMHYKKALGAWNNGDIIYPLRSYSESAFYELGWACHLISDLTVAQHLHNKFIGEHADYEDLGDGKGDDPAYNATTAKGYYHLKDGWSAEQFAKNLANTMWSKDPAHFNKAESGNVTLQNEAIKEAIPLAEKYTAALIAKFMHDINIPATSPPIAGNVYISGKGERLPGAYVFYAPVGSSIQIEQNIPKSQLDPAKQFKSWNCVRADKNGHYTIPTKPFIKYWIRAAMPGYSFEGKTSWNLEFGKRVVPVEFVAPGQAKITSNPLDLYLEKLPVIIKGVELIEGLVVDKTVQLAQIPGQGTLLAAMPDFIVPGKILSRSGTKISSGLSQTIYQSLMKVKCSPKVIGVNNSGTGLSEESVVTIRLSNLMRVDKAQTVTSTQTLIQTIDDTRVKVKNIQAALPDKKILIDPTVTLQATGVNEFITKQQLQALKGKLPRVKYTGNNKNIQQVVQLSSTIEGSEGALKLWKNGLAVVPSLGGAVIEVTAASGSGYLSTNPSSIKITTNKDGIAAFKVKTGTHAGKLRFHFKVIKNPDAVEIKPYGSVEILVHPKLKGKDPRSEVLSKLSETFVPQIMTVTAQEIMAIPQIKILTAALQLSSEGFKVRDLATQVEEIVPMLPDIEKIEQKIPLEPEPKRGDEIEPYEMPIEPVPPGEPGAPIFQDFETDPVHGWEFPGGAQINQIESGRALILSGPGHGIWYIHPFHDFSMHFLYRHGRGEGDIILRMSGEPPEQIHHSIRIFNEGIALLRIEGERESHLRDAPFRFETGQWYHISVEAVEGMIHISVNEQPLLQIHDPDPVPPGALGFGCVHGSGFAYDNIEIHPVGRHEEEGMRHEFREQEDFREREIPPEIREDEELRERHREFREEELQEREIPPEFREGEEFREREVPPEFRKGEEFQEMEVPPDFKENEEIRNREIPKE